MLTSPVKNQVGAIFIHVTDMKRAIAFYNALLGLDEAPTGHAGTIYDLPIASGSPIILDANHPERKGQSDKPLFFFEAENLQAAYEKVQSIGAEIAWPIEEHEDISFFTFRDPDHNMMMICHDKRKWSADKRF
ncbi:VOC family protein [Bacillaceae bacterium SIJ1]|uniref:VOC family protein n=1 Tax=Litoribacterium kuwaitense TaxID=1398745 RepID=UPI0013EA1153|nr:VOC family protein [Litoribacterium kuwaitense]NGP46714.1 VOC family protein [Litoribacterium kuwaitense]